MSTMMNASQVTKVCQLCKRSITCVQKTRNGIEKWRCFSHVSSTASKKLDVPSIEEDNSSDASQKRLNPVNIQMLSPDLHRQVFGSETPEQCEEKTIKKIQQHLKGFKIDAQKNTHSGENVSFSLPPLLGKDISEHFQTLGNEQIEPYRQLLETLTVLRQLPPRPKQWVFKKGWTKYDAASKVMKSVDFPDEDVLVMDVEILVGEGNKPTMATAVSPTAWYSWCSERLVDPSDDWKYTNDQDNVQQTVALDDLIPVESSKNGTRNKSRVIIGHNVGFDRSFIREQYLIKLNKLRFVDTMSLHIAISGMTSTQRILYTAYKKGSTRKEVLEYEERSRQTKSMPLQDWMHNTAPNSLVELYSYYCPEKASLEKGKRDVFVTGNMQKVRRDFQELMQYCSSDVAATHAIFKVMWPSFQQRFPHPVTLAGMLEMGTTYLPVNSNWQRYVDRSEAVYQDMQRELNLVLRQLADEACQLLENHKYKEDVWLWDLDWETCSIRTRKKKATQDKDETESLESVLDKSSYLYAKQPHMPGYPRWYAALCPKEAELESENAGPSKLSTLMRVTPKLLRLTWDGFPLHHSGKYGWGVLVPRIAVSDDFEAELDYQEEGSTEAEDDGCAFPMESFLKLVKETKPEWVEKYLEVSQVKVDSTLDDLYTFTGKEEPEEMRKYWDAIGYDQKGKTKKRTVVSEHIGEERFTDVVPGVDFYRLPHKNGKGHNVGNPLSKDFLVKIEEGVLQSMSGEHVSSVLRYSNMCAYWKSNTKRIRSQMVVPLEKDALPEETNKNCSNTSMVGAILPRVVTAGTVTRRAVEATWLTASNAYPDRIGSELKAMVQSPPGYNFVGADVDSQELWIASVLGDAHFAGIHGCTALGWMVLQGNKKDGTDMHSMTASLVGISRDQAKVFNYGRIYGAGVKFAVQLLMQFNHRLTKTEAQMKARTMYDKTKGKRKRISRALLASLEDEGMLEEKLELESSTWAGGSESHMFNKLEKIARSSEPRTPVLGGRISQTLEPQNVDSGFMPSRINWVVQSSAVDYLHLLLVSLRWLADRYDINMRLSISIHDELRYLVAKKDRYRAALALQIANLLTRSMFAHKLGMNDLPQSVGFFSAVDIDVCLRKEPHMDCSTPSNPQGLEQGYDIPPGMALGIEEILRRTGGRLEAHLQPTLSNE